MTDEQAWDEAMTALIQWEEEVQEHNSNLLKSLNIPLRDLSSILDISELNGKIEVVQDSNGTDQKERHGVFRATFVDQWSVGIEGDSYEGFIYGKIKKRKWLKIPFKA